MRPDYSFKYIKIPYSTLKQIGRKNLLLSNNSDKKGLFVV